jgi:hypothetical protein
MLDGCQNKVAHAIAGHGRPWPSEARDFSIT